ncbi:hypothetical protein [Streptomyces buecherae]|uniref:hypothetical protein n=1 Tax=Streptomyces buecherae TaxID=2763006 RepID=UPI0037BB1AB4
MNVESRQWLWTAEGTYKKGAAVVGDRGVAPHDKPAGDNQVVGLSAADGKDIWTSPRSGLRLSTGGPDAVMT